MRRDFIGLMELQEATQIVNGHAAAVVSARRERGLPTCGDDVADSRKLSALVEEVGEVARALHDDSPLEHLRAELLDVATAATLWAWAVDAEIRLTASAPQERSA